jgi:hypothetical protein
MSQLVPCSVCHRHARLSDRACPFCGGALSTGQRRAVQVPRGAKRAVLFALGISAGATACETFGTQPLYGAVATPSESTNTHPSATQPVGGPDQAENGAPVTPTNTSNSPPTSTPPLPTGPAIEPGQPMYGAPVGPDVVSPTPSAIPELDAGAPSILDSGAHSDDASDFDAGDVESVDSGALEASDSGVEDSGTRDSGDGDSGASPEPVDTGNTDPAPVPVYGAPPSGI